MPLESRGDRHAARDRLTRDFLRFNVYAEQASQCEDADVLALLAVAYEISQVRFQLRRILQPEVIAE